MNRKTRFRWTLACCLSLWMVSTSTVSDILPDNEYEYLPAGPVNTNLNKCWQFALNELGVPERTNMCTMDVYKRKKDSNCVLVWVHGGSWAGGDKRNLIGAPTFLEWWIENQDCNVVAPNFRLARPFDPPIPLPSPLLLYNGTYQDSMTHIAHALKWMVDNKATVGLQENFLLYLFGFSSGSHLATLMATDPSWLDSVGLSTSDLDVVFGFDVAQYCIPREGCQDDRPGVLDYLDAAAAAGNTELADAIPLIEALFSATPDLDPNFPELALAASPRWHAAIPGYYVPPTLIVSSKRTKEAHESEEAQEGYVADNTGREFVEVLTEAGHYAVHEHSKNDIHLTIMTDFGTPGHKPTQAVEAFLQDLDLSGDD